MTDEQLAAIRERAGKATEGPMIRQNHNDIPALLDEVERLRGAAEPLIAYVEKRHSWALKKEPAEPLLGQMEERIPSGAVGIPNELLYNLKAALRGE